MKVCILGAAGLIGSHLSKVFDAAGFQVFGLVRNSPPPLGLHPSGWAIAPIRAEEFLVSGMPWDIVIDCRAFQPSDIKGIHHRVHKITIRWIHLSSIYVYRRLRESWNSDSFFPVPISEETSCSPQGNYGEGKLACEHLWQAAYKGGDRGVTILRLPFVFGPADRSGRIEYYVQRIINGDEIRLPRGGTPRIDLLFAKDLAQIVYMVAERPDTIGHVYNVVAGAPLPLITYIAALAKAVGRKAHIVTLPEGSGAQSASPFAFPTDIVLDGSRLRKVIGPFRATNLERSMYMTVKGHFE